MKVRSSLASISVVTSSVDRGKGRLCPASRGDLAKRTYASSSFLGKDLRPPHGRCRDARPAIAQSVVFNIDGDSYRMGAHLARSERLRPRPKPDADKMTLRSGLAPAQLTQEALKQTTQASTTRPGFGVSDPDDKGGLTTQRHHLDNLTPRAQLGNFGERLWGISASAHIRHTFVPSTPPSSPCLQVMSSAENVGRKRRCSL